MTAIEAQELATRTGDHWWSQAARTMARLQGVTLPLNPPASRIPTSPDPREKEAVNISLSLSAVARGTNTGAFGQHRNPPPGGSISPSSFEIDGRTYSIRGWYNA